jgi:uncharacterized protein (AIM24 family)
MDHQRDRIKGIENTVSGGDGFPLARLTGPGHVWLQALPLPKLAGRCSRTSPNRRARARAAGIVSSILDSR